MTAAIDKLQQLDDDELDALIELAQARANSAMSKREFLKAAGVLGTGAVLGGGAALELTGDAQAAASTVDGDGDIGTPSNPEDVYADALAVFDGANNQIGSFDETGIETPSVDTEEAQATKETFIRATRESGSSSTSSGTFINLLDSESKDKRGEMNSSQQFSPDKDGEYVITGTVDIRGSTSAGDQLRIQVQNVTDSGTVGPTAIFDAPDSFSGVPVVFVRDLLSTKTYEIQGTNFDSSFKAGAFEMGIVIRRSVVQ